MNSEDVISYLNDCSTIEFDRIMEEVDGNTRVCAHQIKTLADAEKEKILQKMYDQLDYKELSQIERIYLKN